MTDWLVQGCDYNPGWFPLYPSRVPSGGVKAYYWNERCLVAPKPKIDQKGYYYWPNWLTRKVIPGLLPAPTGFIGTTEPQDLSNALHALTRRRSKAVDDFLELINGPDANNQLADVATRWGIRDSSLRSTIHDMCSTEHTCAALAGRPT